MTSVCSKKSMFSMFFFTPKFAVACALALSAAFSMAQTQKPSDKETKEDIQRHRAIAAAHEGAAKCLESGKADEVCEKELQAACKGLAIGKYCGMRHVH